MQTQIKKLCLERGITSGYQLERKINKSPKTAINLFNDRVRRFDLEMIGKLCDVLKVSPNQIFIKGGKNNE